MFRFPNFPLLRWLRPAVLLDLLHLEVLLLNIHFTEILEAFYDFYGIDWLDPFLSGGVTNFFDFLRFFSSNFKKST